MNDILIYCDEDAGEIAVVRGLRGRGIDCLTTVEAGNVGASDAEQLAFATKANRSLYTSNVGDFARLHRECLSVQQPHAGIIVIPSQRYSIGDKIRRIAALVDAATAQQMVNRIEYL